jgi:hypothetical protein
MKDLHQFRSVMAKKGFNTLKQSNLGHFSTLPLNSAKTCICKPENARIS